MSTININISKVDLGLDQVDNTSDLNKPISTATQTALDTKVDENAPITGATKTKITYDSKGLVTSGADATTADIADSTNKRYVTDSQATVISNTSGTNTGDQNLSGLVPYTGATQSLVMPLSTNIVLMNALMTNAIAYVDNSNNLQTLSTVTYPNLTELSRVKGLTSAVQTQLDSKLNREPNVQTVTSSATVTALSTNDLVNITAQAVGLTLANPTGTFYNGQIVSYRIKDNATPRTIAYGTKFKAFGSALPTTTVASKITLLSAMYNSVADTFETVNSQEQ